MRLSGGRLRQLTEDILGSELPAYQSVLTGRYLITKVTAARRQPPDTTKFWRRSLHRWGQHRVTAQTIGSPLMGHHFLAEPHMGEERIAFSDESLNQSSKPQHLSVWRKMTT